MCVFMSWGRKLRGLTLEVNNHKEDFSYGKLINEPVAVFPPQFPEGFLYPK